MGRTLRNRAGCKGVVGVFVGVLLALAVHPAGAVEKVSLQALFKDKAIVVIDGKRRVLKSGEPSPEGVRLKATDTQQETATLEVDGKERTIRLGTVVSSFARAPDKGKVTLYPNGKHFYADGTINSVPVRFVVDTGATTIAMNSREARRIGIDYKRFGVPGVSSTAGGFVRTYSLKLERVELGEIVLFNVDAGVVEGGFPQDILLGMSFLGQLDMQQYVDRMELMQR